MPVTITRPRASRIRSTAATKERPSPSWIAAESAVMPSASASSVRTADAIKARPCSLVGLSLLDGFDFAMGSFRADYRARGGARNPSDRPRRHGQRPVNHIRFSFVNQKPIGRGSRPPAGPRRGGAIRTKY